MEDNKYKFPKEFLFGTATSAYQIEGGNFNNDWYEFEQNIKNTKHGEKCGKATDHWNRYQEDFKLLKQMHCNSYRMSIEWSRIFPTIEKIDQNAMKHYQEMINELKKHQIKIMLNLHHFCLPIWFVKKGGLKYKENITYWEEYTNVISEAFGENVEIWSTMNEPMVIVLNGFLFGVFPPKEKSLISSVKVTRNLLRMHASAYKILKEDNPNSLVGFVKYAPLFQPLTNNINDRLRSKLADYMTISLYYRAIKSGKLPFSYLFQYKYLKNASDYIGINYYSRDLASKKHFAEYWGFSGASPNANPEYLCSGLGWQPFPQGLYVQLKRFNKLFPNKPILVAENGIGTDNDEWRQYQLIAHLIEIKRAMNEGVNVMGYHHWSLLDNFEWEHGFGSRFGLIHVNYDTFERILKNSGQFYGKICKNGAIDQLDIENAMKEFPDLEESMQIRPIG